MTAPVDISPDAVERMTAFLERWYQHRPDEGFRIVIAMLNALSSSATARDGLLAMADEAIGYLADISSVAEDEGGVCDELCGARVCDVIGCVRMKQNDIRAILAKGDFRG